MKSASSNSSRNSSHPPLAHDAQGNPIAMPDGTDSWMLKRCTSGRPKVINGTDGRPLRLPLGTTAEQIADTFGPGTYRLDALDEVGTPLDHVRTVEIGRDDDEPADEPGRTFGSSRDVAGDLRFALETIKEMARAQADSLRAVSEAQADWVKGLANAKALPRNAVLAQPPPTMALAAGPDDEDDDRDVPEEAAPSLPAYAIVAQATQGIVHDVVHAFASFVKLRNAAAQATAASAQEPAQTGEASAAVEPIESSAADATQAPPPFRASNPMVHLTEINERLDKTERRYVRAVLRRPGAEALTEQLVARPVEDAVAFVKEQIARMRHAQGAPANDEAPRGERTTAAAPAAPDFITQVYAIGALLTAEEQDAVLDLLQRLPPSRLGQLQQQLVAMTPSDAAAWVRENLASLSAEVAA